MKSGILTKIVGFQSLAVLALTVFSLPVLSRSVSAAPVQTGVMIVGNVDLDKILAGYNKKASYDQQVQDLNAKLDAQFKQQVNYDMLNKDQQAQLTALLSKPSPTSQDQASVTALQQQSDKDAQELAALQQKQNPTTDDQARLQVLSQQKQAGQQILQDVADSYRTQVQDEQQRLSAQLSDTVRLAIIAVAKEKGLTLVFTSQVAIYSTNDITDDVLKRLNGK
jgi:Skp family chaperone for outer membrane proteins